MLPPWIMVKSGWNYLLGKGVAGRNLITFPDDVFLVSYPRSGNTWTRFLIANLIHADEPVSFKNIERIIPDIYVNSHKVLTSLPRPRLIKSHEPFDSRFKKVMYITRDPRDVALSLYHFEVKRGKLPEGYGMDEFLPRFMSGELEGTAGSWGENVASWLATKLNNPAFLLVRYEDLLEDAERELQRIAAFLGIGCGGREVQRAITMSSADHMRALEKRESSDWRTTKNTRQDRPFVRAAAAGQWRTELPMTLVEEIEAAWWPIMKTLGYELETSPQFGPGHPIVFEEVWQRLLAKLPISR